MTDRFAEIKNLLHTLRNLKIKNITCRSGSRPGEEELQLAVFHDGVLGALGHVRNSGSPTNVDLWPDKHELIEWDRRWVFDDTRDDIYSFMYICEQLGIDPFAARRTIREYILHEGKGKYGT